MAYFGRTALLLAIAATFVGSVVITPLTAKQAVESASVQQPAPAVVSAASSVQTKQPAAADTAQAIERGVDFLLTSQNKDGSWGSATRTKDLNIYAPVPGGHHAFRGATTALCVMALCESRDTRTEVNQAIEHGQQWLLANLPTLRRASGDAIYNVWGHAYGIQALVRLHNRLETGHPRREEIIKVINQQIDLLDRYATLHGGWGYYDFNAQTKQPSGSPTSFTTATALVALHEAQGLGLHVPEKMLTKAIATVVRQQKPDFTYLYGEHHLFRPFREINRPGGSLGRSQVCNVALRLYGDEKITDEVLKTWLKRLLDRNGWLSMGRKKPIPHESFMLVAGYFYFYGHYYGALCLEQLPVADRAQFAGRLASIICELQEKDGSWWDYPLYNYHQPYGTSFAILTLVRCK